MATKIKMKDLRELTDAEIAARMREESELLRKMKFSHAVSAIENPIKIRTSRKLIARYKTILGERKKTKA